MTHFVWITLYDDPEWLNMPVSALLYCHFHSATGWANAHLKPRLVDGKPLSRKQLVEQMKWPEGTTEVVVGGGANFTCRLLKTDAEFVIYQLTGELP